MSQQKEKWKYIHYEKADREDKYSVVKITKDETGDITSLNLLTIEEFLVDLGVASNIPEGEEEDYSEYYDVADAVKANTNYKIFENLPLPWSIPEKLLPVFAAF